MQLTERTGRPRHGGSGTLPPPTTRGHRSSGSRRTPLRAGAIEGRSLLGTSCSQVPRLPPTLWLELGARGDLAPEACSGPLELSLHRDLLQCSPGAVLCCHRGRVVSLGAAVVTVMAQGPRRGRWELLVAVLEAKVQEAGRPRAAQQGGGSCQGCGGRLQGAETHCRRCEHACA